MSIANFFRRPHYRSDTTQFIDEMKAKHPEIEAGQQVGRALLWDQDIDRRASADIRAGEIKQQAYVYQTSGQA